jgi:anti-sigma B factor antagonist
MLGRLPTGPRHLLEAVVHDLDSLFWVQRTVDNLSVVVQASGELDVLTAPRLSAQLDQAEAIVVPPAPVVLDLTGITFLGSAGLAVLIAHHERCAALGSSLRIMASSRAVTRPLTATALDRVLNLVPELAPTAG